MKTYLVTWRIEIDADSPYHAAEQAQAIQLDADSQATIFEVQEGDGEPVLIDLYNYAYDEDVMYCDGCGCELEEGRIGLCDECMEEDEQ